MISVGYDRWETAQELALLGGIYDDLRLYINFFQLSFKLIAKERVGSQSRKLQPKKHQWHGGQSNLLRTAVPIVSLANRPECR